MSEYPRTDSDIQCEVCFEWFTLDGDLIDHREQTHHLHAFQLVVSSNVWRCACGTAMTNEQHRIRLARSSEPVRATPDQK